jgi:hypothetical protein
MSAAERLSDEGIDEACRQVLHDITGHWLVLSI